MVMDVDSVLSCLEIDFYYKTKQEPVGAKKKNSELLMFS